MKMLLVIALAAMSTAAAAAEPRHKPQCRALEQLGRWAQAKINAGHVATASQIATYERKRAWYERNCR